MNITKSQIIQIRTMISKLFLDEEKDNIILTASGDRTTSTKELTYDEADKLIRHLRNAIVTDGDKANRMRRKILSCCYQMRMIKPSDSSIDMDQVNAMVAAKGYLKGDGKVALNDYTVEDLPKLVTQFERFLSHYLKKK